MPQTSKATGTTSPERRSHGRVNVQSGLRSITYVELGGGRFGIIKDISEGGLAMQTVGLVAGNDFPGLCFRLSPFGNPIRPSTQVTWKSTSTKTVGLRFLVLSPAERMELRGWVFTQLPMENSNPIISGSPTPETPSKQLSDPFDQIQKLLTRSTPRRLDWRKWIQWGLAAVLAVVLASCLIVLWRLRPRTSLGNLSTISSRSVVVIHSILDYTTHYARGAFHLQDSKEGNSKIVPGPVSLKPKALSSGPSRTRVPSNDSPAAATLFQQPVDTANPVLSASDDAASGPAACRNRMGSAAAINADSGQNDGILGTTADASLAEPVLTIGPAYPVVDAQGCVDGTVRLHATIDRNGGVRNLRPVSGPATLFEAAMTAARYWRFRPVVSQGQAVESDRDIQVVFRNMLADTQ